MCHHSANLVDFPGVKVLFAMARFMPKGKHCVLVRRLSFKGSVMKTSFKVPVRIRSTVLGAMTALAVCAPAHAFTTSIGDLQTYVSPGSAFFLGQFSFNDTIGFTLSAPTMAAFAVQGQVLNLGYIIPAATSLSMSIYKGTTLLAGPGVSFAGLSLAAGTDYSFQVAGTGSGLYSVNWYLSPVPEPESLALALAGLGAVGTLMRRRRDSDNRS